MTEPAPPAEAAVPDQRDPSLEALATVSHEMRTALGGIFGMTTLLADEAIDPTQRRHVEALRGATETLARLLDDVIDLARLDRDGFAIEMRPFSAADLIAGLVELERPRAAARGLTLVATIAPDVPVSLLGDGVRVRQVLANLVGNAIKFTERSGIAIDVAVAARGRTQTTLGFAVTDTGPGIPAEEAATLFARFRQGEGGRRRGGAGLGLWISRTLVERMGGEIAVAPAPGGGSRLHFTVPFGRAAVEPQDHARRAPGALASLNLLLAEDNEINRMFLATILERAGHRVDVVATGAQAVAMARWTVYDAILMDLNMPVTCRSSMGLRRRAQSARSAMRAAGRRSSRSPLMPCRAIASAASPPA
ncbi:MAG: response regulator [Alphaproteobacteria bacterium]|nr:response regulator [Alphaproteobacteria bacterium]